MSRKSWKVGLFTKEFRAKSHCKADGELEKDRKRYYCPMCLLFPFLKPNEWGWWIFQFGVNCAFTMFVIIIQSFLTTSPYLCIRLPNIDTYGSDRYEFWCWLCILSAMKGSPSITWKYSISSIFSLYFLYAFPSYCVVFLCLHLPSVFVHFYLFPST